MYWLKQIENLAEHNKPAETFDAILKKVYHLYWNSWNLRLSFWRFLEIVRDTFDKRLVKQPPRAGGTLLLFIASIR